MMWWEINAEIVGYHPKAIKKRKFTFLFLILYVSKFPYEYMNVWKPYVTERLDRRHLQSVNSPKICPFYDPTV